MTARWLRRALTTAALAIAATNALFILTGQPSHVPLERVLDEVTP